MTLQVEQGEVFDRSLFLPLLLSLFPYVSSLPSACFFLLPRCRRCHRLAAGVVSSDLAGGVAGAAGLAGRGAGAPRCGCYLLGDGARHGRRWRVLLVLGGRGFRLLLVLVLGAGTLYKSCIKYGAYLCATFRH